MVIVSKVFLSSYRDSVVLMRIASMIRDIEGVLNAEVMMATDSNKEVLSRSQLLNDEVAHAGPADLLICVMAEDEKIAKEAVSRAEDMIIRGAMVQRAKRVTKSINGALALLPDANLALISIPGPYVKKEALKALKKGLNVLIFSDNVPMKDEIEIKRFAKGKGLLVMGPDCGTAIINGVALGFANKIRRGHVGMVGSSGTGLQEVAVLLHHLGLGISHAIGTGSKDVLDQVGGLAMIQGISLLEADPATEVIILISKPLGERTLQVILARLEQCRKPVIANFLGEHTRSFVKQNIQFTVTLEETALTVAKRIGGPPQISELSRHDWIQNMQDKIKQESMKLTNRQKYVRGLFGGGTLATEACIIMRDVLSPLWGNISLNGVSKLPDSRRSKFHCIIDLGADEFTCGKPHPMLEPEMRKERLFEEAQDPEVAVILMDFVLGYGVHPDPVGATVPYIEMAKKLAEKVGSPPAMVASVCGTDDDPQNRSCQIALLEQHGVIVLHSNAQATRVAAAVALRSWRILSHG